MNELIRHIETLLLENDYVVIPEFGGFIVHYMPASWSDDEGIFLPPTRSIAFNTQLRMNDGVLVQAYMAAYNTHFSDATKIIEKGVNKLIQTLHKESEIELGNIGKLSVSVHGLYNFSPYENTMTSPHFYGLDAFEFKELKSLQQLSIQEEKSIDNPVRKKNYEIRINRSFVRNAVASVAAILLFFYMSTPIENTYVEDINYAQLLPNDLFGQIKKQSLLTTSIGMSTSTRFDSAIQEEVIQNPIVVKEVKVPKNAVESAASAKDTSVSAQRSSKQYHIIVASVASKNDAQTMVSNLQEKGFSDACVLVENNKIRVSLVSYSNREEANKQLIEIRKNNAYTNAWLLVK